MFKPVDAAPKEIPKSGGKEMDWKFKLSEVQIQLNQRHFIIGITAEGPYNRKVRSPKIVAVVKREGDERRFQILTSSYFPLEDMKTCVVYAEYPVNVDALFLSDRDCDYEISFDYIYGEDTFRGISFESVPNANYLEEQGVSFRKSDGKLVIHPNHGKAGGLLRFWHKLQIVLGGIYQFLTYVIALFLLPWYIIDAIASILLGISNTFDRNVGSVPRRFLTHISWRYSRVCKYNVGITGFKLGFMKFFYGISHIFPVKKNRILFLSSRRDDLSGNFSFLYDILKEDDKLDMKMVLEPKEIKEMPFFKLAVLGHQIAVSRIILIDDFTPLLSKIVFRKETRLIQVWHACGAFKTFGFSRTGKRGGPRQTSLDHRNYSYALVSSREIRPFYAEGFGISTDKVVATGMPRTDVFFDEEYRTRITKELHETYPQTVGKKVVLFAPTFRGNGKLSANYPREAFDPVRFIQSVPEDYMLIIKHHPFVEMEYEIPDKYQDRILDLSMESEINDLLFITDVLITDYSSVVFEAALLRIPMLMYAFDLRQYIASRDFYYDYEFFVPGKIVETFKGLVAALKAQDFEQEKLEQFRTRFFDDFDGKSSQRVVDMIYRVMENGSI